MTIPQRIVKQLDTLRAEPWKAVKTEKVAAFIESLRREKPTLLDDAQLTTENDCILMTWPTRYPAYQVAFFDIYIRFFSPYWRFDISQHDRRYAGYHEREFDDDIETYGVVWLEKVLPEVCQ